MLLFLLFGCSHKVRYQVLSFFFDGIPVPVDYDISLLPDSVAEAEKFRIAAIYASMAKPEFNFHEPYHERKCNSCHDQNQTGMLKKNITSLCYDCHDNFEKKYAYLHGPVSGGYCIQCHSPHMSKYDKLLVKEGNSLCFQCHNSELVMTNPHHSGKEETHCTKCHNPHGGDNRFALYK
jgi:predicted CXXCH cytochrome family protein